MLETQSHSSPVRVPCPPPVILGGSLTFYDSAIGDLLDLLNIPQLIDAQAIDYSFLEATDHLRFEKALTIYDGSETKCSFDQLLVERLRLFGMSADLEVRRDSDILLWRLITDELPAFAQSGNQLGRLEFKTFLDSERLVAHDVRFNLWGSREQATDGPYQLWYDERVASSRVTYPVDGSHKRVYIFGTEYIADGITQFTRWRGLEGGE